MTRLDVSMRQRTPTPRKLPSALPALETAVHVTTRAVTIANMPGYRTVVVPAGTTVELLGVTERTGLPRIRCDRYGVDDAIVSEDAIGLADQPTRTAHSQSRCSSTRESSGATPQPCESSPRSTNPTASASSATSSATSSRRSSTGSSPKKRKRRAPGQTTTDPQAPSPLEAFLAGEAVDARHLPAILHLRDRGVLPGSERLEIDETAGTVRLLNPVRPAT